ncbi:kinase-like domain-containing protein, partial [Schizophyllum commune]
MLQPWDLPDWTITRYEIDREIKIGVGYFSDVYKGTWKGRAVAIKVLAPTTPRKLFVREAGIWRGLRHRNVLQLFGASSAVEGGMWFLVSPYLPNGTLVEYLKRVESRIAAGLEGPGSPRLGGQGSPRLGATSPRRSTAGHAKLATSPGSPIMEAGTARAGGFALPSLDDSASAHQRTMSLDRHSPMRPPGPARQDSLSVGLLRASLEAQSPSRTPSSSSSASTTPTGEAVPPMPGPTPPTEGDEDPADVLRYLLEIARGMEYLHSKGVLHGDLKACILFLGPLIIAANVLVDDNHHAVISDFGQSEMRSEVYRISGLGGHGHGTLRWQAPELLSGATERITTETDVYAFAITAVEVLGFGRLPWGQLDDEAVRWAVLSTFIHGFHTTPVLLALLRACWARDPFKRPMFSQVVRDVKRLRKQAGWIERSEDKASEQPPDALTNEEMIASMPSPDLKPMPLPGGMS